MLQEKGILKEFFMFQEIAFRAQKMKRPTLKKLLIFQEIELFNPKLRKIILYFFIFFKKRNLSYYSFFF